MNHFLFVYGTLRKGFRNEHAEFLAEHATHRGPARLRGRMYEINGYPGITPSPDHGDQVSGDLYELHAPALVLARLDDYEGYAESAIAETCDYLRQEMNVHLLSGQTLKAWVYLYNREVDERQRIYSGDYRRYLGRPEGKTAAKCTGG